MSHGRPDSIGRPVALLTVVRVGSVAAGFATSIIAARLLGAADLGIAGAALTLATIGALMANGGLNIAAIYHLGQRQSEQQDLVGWIMTLGAATACLAIVVIVVGILLVGEAVVGPLSVGLVGATAVLGASLLIFELAGGILLGIQRRIAYIVVQAVEAVSSLILTAVLLILVSASAPAYLLGAALAYSIGTALALFVAGRAVGGARLSASKKFVRQAFAMGIRGQAGNVLQYLNLRLDLLLVPALLNLPSAGIYLIAVRLSEVLTQVANSAASFLFPQVASQPNLRSTDVTELTVRLTLLTVVVGSLPLFVLAGPILSVAFGDSFAAGTQTVRITLFAMIPLSMVRLLAGDLKGRGRAGLVSLSAVASLISTVILDLTLIPLLGINGAAIASLGSYSIAAVVLIIAYRAVTGGSLMTFVPTHRDVGRLFGSIRRGRPHAGGSK